MPEPMLVTNAGDPDGCFTLDLASHPLPADEFTTLRHTQREGRAGRVALMGIGGHHTVTLYRAEKDAEGNFGPVQKGASLGGFNATGYGQTCFNAGHSSSDVSLSLTATETFSDTAHGTRLELWVTRNGTNGRYEGMALENDGRLTVAAGTITIADQQGNLYSGGQKVVANSGVQAALAALAWFLVGLSASSWPPGHLLALGSH